MIVWTESDLLDHLFAIAKARAARDGRTFKPAAQSLVLSLLRSAANQLVSPQVDIGTRDGEIAQAEVDVVTLVEGMIRAAELIPDNPRDELGENTFDRIKDWFCPRRPFC
jgi:hypothetical protein